MKRSLLQLIIASWAVATLPARGESVKVSREALQGPTNPSGTYRILAIGVSTYADPFWTSLKFPARDADAFSQRVIGDGKSNRSVTLLKDRDATLANVRKAMKAIAASASKSDTIIVYVSGHGSLSPGRSGELDQLAVLHDSRKDDLTRTALLHAELRQWVDRLPSARKVLVLATCHSGVGKSRLTPQVQEVLAASKGTMRELSHISEGVLVLAAAAKGETAREDVKLGGDIYTHFLLEALTAGDRNQDGVVTILEAHDYAKERTYRVSAGRQRPTIEAQLVGDADVVLAGKRQGKGLPVLEAYDAHLAGFSVSVDGGAKGELPTGFPLKPGKNRVTLLAPNDGRPVARFDVSAQSGQKLSLADLFSPPPFRIAAGLALRQWDDGNVKKVVGTSLPSWTVQLGATWRSLLLEGSYGRATYSGGKPRPGVEVSVNDALYSLGAGYIWRTMSGLEWSLGLGYGREHLSLTIADEGGGSSIHATSVSSVLTGYGQLAWAVGSLLPNSALTLRAAREHFASGFDFGDVGEVTGGRMAITLGYSFSWGSVARRL